MFKIVLCGDSFIVGGSFDLLNTMLGDDEQKWVKMLKDDGEFEVLVDDGVGTRVSLEQMKEIIEVGTGSSQMDGMDD